MTTTLKMATTIIKTLFLLLVMNLAFSCSNNNNNSPSTGAKAQNDATKQNTPDTIIINGTVKALTFGKDGYTADVRTAKEGNYNALVSIVNVGGRENYKSCEVGDTVTFEGILSVLDNIRQLKVTKIISITTAATAVNTEGVAALNAKYSKIQNDDYCWQINKVLNLHTQPTPDSKVEGKHFAGEMLKVLGTKLINNQLWVNVQYQLKIKAGYEDQFADGQVMSSGLPTGWIGGAEKPIINCK